MKRRRWKSNLPLMIHHPGLFIRAYWPSLLILLTGAMLDAITTYRNAIWLGAEAELHPAGRIFMEVFGCGPGTWLAKLVQVSAVLFVAALWRPWCRVLMVLCGLLYAAAAISNHFHLL